MSSGSLAGSIWLATASEGSQVGLRGKPFWYARELNVYDMGPNLTRMELHEGNALELANARVAEIVHRHASCSHSIARSGVTPGLGSDAAHTPAAARRIQISMMTCLIAFSLLALDGLPGTRGCFAEIEARRILWYAYGCVYFSSKRQHSLVRANGRQ
jgi:hypothetical protein